MSVFDDVARAPRKGDVLKITGGQITYEVTDPDPSVEGPFTELEVTRLEQIPGSRSSGESRHKVDSEVWADLVRLAVTVERAP